MKEGEVLRNHIDDTVFPFDAFEWSQLNETTVYLKIKAPYKLVIGTLEITAAGYIKPITSTDADAPNNSIYYSSTQNNLVYKDSGGVVNNLY